MKFSNKIKKEAIPEWKSYHINYEKLRIIIETYQKNKRNNNNNIEYINNIKEKYSNEFFEIILFEFNKVEEFYKRDIVKRNKNSFKNLKREIGSAFISLQNTYNSLLNETFLPQSPIEEYIDLNKIKENRRNDKKFNNRYKSIKFAFLEFYVSLCHAQIYCQLNSVGFRKICKKFDKVFESDRGISFMSSYVNKSKFKCNVEVLELMQSIENIYVKIFTKGNRSKGMARLRVISINEDKKVIDQSCYLLGFFSSACVINIIMIFISLLNVKNINYNLIHLYIFGGELLFIVFIVGFSFNLFIWSKYNINHVLIFEIDPRKHINYINCMWLSLLLLFIWLIFILIYINYQLILISQNIIVIISICMFIFLLINPFKLFVNSRYWTLKIIFHNFQTPFIPVNFVDFWMYDQLCSLSNAIMIILYYIPCFISSVNNSHDTCFTNNIYITYIIMTIPYYIRFIQCLRRYRDFKYNHINDIAHIFNSLKYLLSIISLWFNYIFLMNNKFNNILFGFLIFIKLISTCYLVFWDIVIDWSFFGSTEQLKNNEWKFKLRDNIIYHYYYYYMALINNIIIRYIPIFFLIYYQYTNLSPPISFLINMSIYILEVFRRIVWNFFRVENEHINNIGRFRTIRDIDLFKITNIDGSISETLST